VNDPRFRDHPMILETPKKGPDGEDMDPMNFATLRWLLPGADGGAAASVSSAQVRLHSRR
jgi:hypothetical protein